MKIMLIYPSVGQKTETEYIHTWQMQPLTIAQIKSLIPDDIETVFYDDRIEKIDYDTDCDAVMISIETYTASRAYTIADNFRRRNIPVICGGYHATLFPEEVKQHCDTVIEGEAEPVICDVINDLKQDRLKDKYRQKRCSIDSIMPDRSIFENKRYMPLSLVESSRGCPYNCGFCSVSAFHNRIYKTRPIDMVIEDIKTCRNNKLFIVDDNLIADIDRAKELMRRMIPLNIRWAGQGSLHMANDPELLSLMKQSGCSLILIGFESLDKKTLSKMDKEWNTDLGNTDRLIRNIHNAGIGIYATFVFGYGEDNEETFRRTYNFAMRNKFLFAAFNHLVPFPGTKIYNELNKQNRLIYDKWWTSPDYHYGDIAFYPPKNTAENIRDLCVTYRKKFFSIMSIIRRTSNYKANIQDWEFAPLYFAQSFLARKEIDMKLNLIMGDD